MSAETFNPDGLDLALTTAEHVELVIRSGRGDWAVMTSFGPAGVHLIDAESNAEAIAELGRYRSEATR